MRVLLVAPEFPPAVGGMQAHAGETATRLAARGHAILVLTSLGNTSSRVAYPFEVQPVLGRDFRAATGRIVAAAERFIPDVLLLMNAGFAPLASRYGDLLPPIVVRTAGNDAYAAWCGPRHPLRFAFWRLPHRHPESLGARLRRMDQDRRVDAVLSGLSSCARVLCNSSYSLARLRDLGVAEGRLHLMIGGVDTGVFRPGDVPARIDSIGADACVLGLAGHLLPIKGIDIALNMLGLLRERSPQTRLSIAGAGPEEPRLRSLARQLALESRVDFLGNLQQDQLAQFYRRLDLYLQPSIEVRHDAAGTVMAETMGRALCEAEASGVPVVASRIGGIPDVVRDGVTGILVTPGDPGLLADAVAGLLGSPDRRRLMGEAGRRLAIEQLSWDTVVDQTERHLESARAGPSRNPPQS